MLLLAALLALAPDPVPIDVLVVVPLCDGAALDCGRAGGLGDPRSLDRNLYWGALYGAERFLAKAPGFRIVARADTPDRSRPALLREVTLEHRHVRVRLQAWDGARIDDALAAFLAHAEAPGDVELLVWAGHDRLMDVAAPAARTTSSPARVAVLACESAQYFGPALEARGAQAVALTRTFMAPEAYLLEALVRTVAERGVDDRARIRDALVDSYAKHQRISKRAASSVFAQLQ